MLYGHYGRMKITIEIPDEILVQAKRYAQKTGHQLDAVVEEELRCVLDAPPVQNRYVLPGLRVGDPDRPNRSRGTGGPRSVI